MRQGSNVLDQGYFDTGTCDGTDSAFATGTGALYKYVCSFQTSVNGNFSSIAGGQLRSIGGVLLGTLETHFAGRGPGDNLTLFIGDAYNDVIEAS